MVGRATNCCSYSDLLNKLSPILSDSKLKESWSAVEINLRSLDVSLLYISLSLLYILHHFTN
jgi:hypothetical protein